MARGRKTGGRKKGTPNKIKAPDIKAKIAEVQAETLARAEAVAARMTPLEYMLDVMNDETCMPGMRLEAAKAAAPYIHSKAPEALPEKTQQITEIRRIIVSPRDIIVEEDGRETVIDEGRYSNGDPVERARRDADR